MITLRTFPAQVPMVNRDGTLSQPSLQTMLTMVEAIRELQGSAGTPGGSSDATVFTQSTPATVWVIDHNKGRKVVVMAFDTSGNRIEGTVSNPTLNRTTLVFSEAIAGSVTFI